MSLCTALYIYKRYKSIIIIYVTECIVCVPGYDPLTFLSGPFLFWLGGSFMAPVI